MVTPAGGPSWIHIYILKKGIVTHLWGVVTACSVWYIAPLNWAYFQERRGARLGIVRTGARGFGVKTLESLVAGRYVGEYCGEAIDSPNEAQVAQ